MKSKIVKRVLAASLVTAMAVGMVGCGGEETTTTPSSTPTESKTDTPADPATPAEPADDVSPYPIITDASGNTVDLGGIDVVIRDWWSTGELPMENAYDEARAEYLEWAQETYNFTITEKAISDWGSTPTDFAQYAPVGGDEYYVFTLRSGSELNAAIESGYMYDLSTLDCLDFSEPKWSSGVHKYYSGSNGEIYCMRGIDAEPRRGVFFNKRILEEAGINPDDLYKWQDSGEWTWAKFEEVCAAVQQDVDNDGVIDIYGMTQQRSEFYSSAVTSNNGHFINKVDGQYVNELESANTLEALNWAVETANKYDLPQPEGSEWNYFFAEFTAGKACFMAGGQVYMAGQEFKDMEDDFGFVCFPMGPQADKYISTFDDNAYAIPSCYDADKAWKIAFAYNLYTEPIPGFEDAATWKASYYGKFRDTESVDNTLVKLVEGGIVTYHALVSGIDLGPQILWGLGFADAEGVVETPAQAGERLRNSWAEYIDAANGK